VKISEPSLKYKIVVAPILCNFPQNWRRSLYTKHEFCTKPGWTTRFLSFNRFSVMLEVHMYISR
jgi:hypothetical protein